MSETNAFKPAISAMIISDSADKRPLPPIPLASTIVVDDSHRRGTGGFKPTSDIVNAGDVAGKCDRSTSGGKQTDRRDGVNVRKLVTVTADAAELALPDGLVMLQGQSRIRIKASGVPGKLTIERCQGLTMVATILVVDEVELTVGVDDEPALATDVPEDLAAEFEAVAEALAQEEELTTTAADLGPTLN
jgi:hypothetical protein